MPDRQREPAWRYKYTIRSIETSSQREIFATRVEKSRIHDVSFVKSTLRFHRISPDTFVVVLAKPRRCENLVNEISSPWLRTPAFRKITRRWCDKERETVESTRITSDCPISITFRRWISVRCIVFAIIWWFSRYRDSDRAETRE